jgi:hypothetical protein
LETTIAAKEDDYKQLNPTDQHAKMLELESDIQELRQNMAKASGSKEELKRQLKETLRELKDKKFKDIENRVRKLTIHHKTVEMAIKDLERYGLCGCVGFVDCWWFLLVVSTPGYNLQHRANGGKTHVLDHWRRCRLTGA